MSSQQCQSSEENMTLICWFVHISLKPQWCEGWVQEIAAIYPKPTVNCQNCSCESIYIWLCVHFIVHNCGTQYSTE